MSTPILEAAQRNVAAQFDVAATIAESVAQDLRDNGLTSVNTDRAATHYRAAAEQVRAEEW